MSTTEVAEAEVVVVGLMAGREDRHGCSTLCDRGYAMGLWRSWLMRSSASSSPHVDSLSMLSSHAWRDS